jgi:hypothetical protein
LLLGGVIFAASWWLTPVKPYATLKVDDDCRLLLFSPDSSMLVTSGKECEVPIHIWDVAGAFERFSLGETDQAAGACQAG